MEHPVEYHIEYRTKYLMECIIPSIFIVCLIEDHLEYSIEYIREPATVLDRVAPVYRIYAITLYNIL